jgi:hypothetical protein
MLRREASIRAPLALILSLAIATPTTIASLELGDSEIVVKLIVSSHIVKHFLKLSLRILSNNKRKRVQFY